MRAARRICQGWIKPADLPTNREIRDEIQSLARLQEGSRQHRPTAESRDASPDNGEPPTDRFQVYHRLLLPLETVRQDPRRHPEGDALYHSLQVYALARRRWPMTRSFKPRPYCTTWAKRSTRASTSRRRWRRSTVTSLHGRPGSSSITPKPALREGTLGSRARRRLEASEDYDDLVLLSDCDRAGRVAGALVPDVEDALDQLRELAGEDGFES